VRSAGWALLLLALPAGAYERSKNSAGLCTWWASRGHSFQIDSQGTPDVTPVADAFDAIRRSFQTWSQVTCSDLAFAEEALSTDPANRKVGYFNPGPNHNLVLFRTRACSAAVPSGDACRTQGGCSNLYDCWDDGQSSSVIASTLVTSNRQTGEILDTDIEMNDAPRGSAAAFKFAVIGTCAGSQSDCGIDVQNTVTHEAGHTLGLDHSANPSATMYASGPPGETSKRDLFDDDIQGICAIYPKGAATVTCVPPDSGGCGCSAAQTGPGAALWTLLLLLQISRRSRRRPQLPIKASTKPAATARSQSGSEN